MKKGNYNFTAKVFGLLTSPTLSKIDLFRGNEPDGMLYEVLEPILKEFELNKIDDDWIRMISLKFDACHNISDKVLYIPTNLLDLLMKLSVWMCSQKSLKIWILLTIFRSTRWRLL